MSEDAPTFASMSDAASTNECMILSIRATPTFSNVCQKLWERKVELVSLSRQRNELKEEVYTLKDENKGLKKHLKRVKKIREAIAERLIFYQDFINTKVVEFYEELEEVQNRMNQIQRTSHQDSHISLKR